MRRYQPQRLRRRDALRHCKLDADGCAEGHSLPAGLVTVVHLGIHRDAEGAHSIITLRLVCDLFSAQSEKIGISVKLELLQPPIEGQMNLTHNGQGPDALMDISLTVPSMRTRQIPHLGQLRTK